MLSLSDSTFSGGGDDEGSVAANSVMPALADGDRGDGQQDPPQGPPYPLPDWSQQCSLDGQQDPPQGPPYPLPDRSQQCSLESKHGPSDGLSLRVKKSCKYSKRQGMVQRMVMASYTSSHLEVSESAACLEEASLSCTSGHVEVFQNLLLICHP
ncbi:hypothetical protein Tco_0610941 [Tanacetum coccineum]